MLYCNTTFMQDQHHTQHKLQTKETHKEHEFESKNEEGIKGKFGAFLKYLKNLLKQRDNQIILGVFFVFLFLSLGLIVYANSQNDYRNTQNTSKYDMEDRNEAASPSPDMNDGSDSETSPSPSPKASSSPTSSPKPSATPTTTPTPTPSPSATPRIPNPKKFRISYPSEGQYIEMGSSQTLCVVTVPEGGDNTGLQWSYRLNNGNWTSFDSTLCFTPKDGDNSIEMKTRNAYGDEYNPGVRNFKFKKLSDLSYSVSGVTFADIDCDMARDTNESILSGPVNFEIKDIDRNTVLANGVDNDGKAEYSASYPSSETRYISINLTRSDNYTRNPGYQSAWTNFRFSGHIKQNSFYIEIPYVPNENINNCSGF